MTIRWNVTHAGHVVGTVEGRSYSEALYEARLAYGPNVRLSAHPRPTERS